MLDLLIGWDRELLLAINSNGSIALDTIMLLLSHKWIWAVLYAFLLFQLYRSLNAKWTIAVLIAVAIMITLSDQMSVHLFKNQFERLRPCHDPDLKSFVHTFNGKCGGQFGFVSSHAANTMALAMFLFIVMRNHWGKASIILIIWSLLVGYSRVYLGVHFPADILGGWLLGGALGFLIASIYGLARNRLT